VIDGFAHALKLLFVGYFPIAWLHLWPHRTDKGSHYLMFKKQSVIVVLCAVVGLATGGLLPVTAAPNAQTAVQKLADQAVADGLPGVSIAVYVPKSPLIVAVAGKSDIRADTDLIPTDLSRIASISKMYVATVIMQLIETGKITAADRIGQYLNADDARHIANVKTATIGQVLSHTSGIFDYYNDADFGADKPDQYNFTIEEALHYAWDQPALFAPGKKYSYSDSNTLLLALVIEKVTGNSFAQEVRSRILTPLKLDHTFTEIFEPTPQLTIHGYDFDKNGRSTDYFLMQGAGLPDGGIITTPTDMVSFFKGLLVDGKLLQPATLAEMLKPRADAGDGSAIGYHIFVQPMPNGDTWYSHSGGIAGYQAELLFSKKTGVIVALWANGTGKNQDNAFDILYTALQSQFIQ
jgi:D-alanyl-D-alanine carboxypeptidase